MTGSTTAAQGALQRDGGRMLAVLHGGRLITFDRNIPMAAAEGAEAQHLVTL
ncbi:MAG: hypothetical protein JJT93_02175 [Gammaproteobacteria bacterium]|nr:hypothetical protein [Gammaproteobacteria bacterium]